jgi:serine/threonine protein kinase
MSAGWEGEKLGKWRIGRLIGSGGMGDVYVANREGGDVQQIAAVKVLRANPESNEDEAAALRMLRHRNIARRFEDGLTPGGQRYIVLEYVDGPSITDFADQRGLSIRDRVTLFLEACDAIDYVHTRTWLHLDIKPSNLLVDSDGVVKVIDFGIARRAGGAGAAGGQYATRPYASPEQISSSAGVGFASDIYSLGAVLYELLSGHPPFEANASSPPLDWRIAEEIPLRPSDALARSKVIELGSGARRAIEPSRLAAMRGDVELSQARRELAGDLDKICLFALRKAPYSRYRSVAALIVDLKASLAGNRPPAARSEDPLYHALIAARSYPLAGVAVFLILCAIAAFSVFPHVFLEARVESEHRTQQAQDAADQAIAALRSTIRPQLASDPQAQIPLNLLDATLQSGARPAPVESPFEELAGEWRRVVRVWHLMTGEPK